MKIPRFWRDDRGNMAVLFAVGFTLSALVSALAVDVAALYYERRQLQAGVDLAAISAATDPMRAAEIARSVLAEARLLDPASTDGLIVRAGRYEPTEARIVDRFRPNATPFNAVEVTLSRTGELYFAGSLFPRPETAARGLAAITPEVSFSIGSRLASLNGGLANAILSQLLGTSISLDVMDYRALADAEVEAFAFLDALATRLGVTAGTYDQLLAMEAGPGPLAGALADLTNGTARTALNTIASAGQGVSVPLDRLLSLGKLGALEIGSAGAAGIGASLSALELLSAAAALADGDRQLSLNLGAEIAGLTRLKLDLALGEPPRSGGWFGIGPAGTVLRTAQLRVRIEAGLLGGPVLLGAGVRLPVWLDLAHSEAMVASATCPTSSHPRGTATIAVRPGLARLALGELTDGALHNFATPPPIVPARLVDLLLLRITGSALVDVGQTAPVRLDFSSADIAAGTMRTVRTTTIGSSLLGSLFANLDLTIAPLGSLRLITNALAALLAPLGPVLDLTLDAILNALGLGVGEADIRVYGVRCQSPVLVG